MLNDPPPDASSNSNRPGMGAPLGLTTDRSGENQVSLGVGSGPEMTTVRPRPLYLILDTPELNGFDSRSTRIRTPWSFFKRLGCTCHPWTSNSAVKGGLASLRRFFLTL